MGGSCRLLHALCLITEVQSGRWTAERAATVIRRDAQESCRAACVAVGSYSVVQAPEPSASANRSTKEPTEAILRSLTKGPYLGVLQPSARRTSAIRCCCVEWAPGNSLIRGGSSQLHQPLLPVQNTFDPRSSVFVVSHVQVARAR